VNFIGARWKPAASWPRISLIPPPGTLSAIGRSPMATQPASEISTHALKPQLLTHRAQLAPEQVLVEQRHRVGARRVRRHNLDHGSADPIVRRTIEVATVLWRNERR
jgi:hypothetical protein